MIILLLLQTKLVKTEDSFAAKQAEWQKYKQQLEAKLHEHKSKRREEISNENSKRKDLERDIHDLNEWIMELDEEMKAARVKERQATKKLQRSNALAHGRLLKLRQEGQTRRDTEDELVGVAKELHRTKEELQIASTLLESSSETKRHMKKEWEDSGSGKRTRGGSRRWPTWVVLMICELLVNGTAPSAIPSNIQTLYETLYQEKPQELPSVWFVRRCRVVVEVMCETLAAIKIASASEWGQLWTDGTSRRQTSFTALIVGILTDAGDIDPVVISSCIFMEDETSQMQVDGLVNKVITYI